MSATAAKTIPPLLVLDGGTGRELQRRGAPFRQPEWSALALYEAPEIVQQVHESFIEAGATLITTNTYAIVPFHIGTERYQCDGRRLLQLAVDLCEQARGERNDIQILGSIPPICGSYEPSLFDPIVAAPIVDDFLAGFGGRVDAILLETVGSMREATFYLDKIRAARLDCPVWLSFCLQPPDLLEPRLLTGESLMTAVKELEQAGYFDYLRLDAVLVNCCDIQLVADATRQLQQALVHRPNIRLGAYPNAFCCTHNSPAANAGLRRLNADLTAKLVQQQAQEWIEAGCSIIGGCCGVGPEHIRAMAALKEAVR